MKTAITWLVIIILAGVGIWWFGFHTPSPTTDMSTVPAGDTDQQMDNPAASTGESMAGDTMAADDNMTTPTAPAMTPKTVTVHLTASGFSPNTVNIAKGDKVTWVNDTTGSMWVASAVHPDHTLYDTTDRSTHCSASYTGATPFDQCGNGGTYSFTFDKAGTWKYHNHLNASQTGSVTVSAN